MKLNLRSSRLLGWLLVLPIIAWKVTGAEVDRTFFSQNGPNGTVYSIAIQPDEKILLAGQFTSIAGQLRAGLARVNPDGTLDPGFDPGPGANTPILAVAVQEDGKIVAGGAFTTFANLSRVSMARLHPDGTLDESFDPGTGSTFIVWDPPRPIHRITPLPGGELMIAGLFRVFDGVSHNGISRLGPDGRPDASFNPPWLVDGQISTFLGQAGGRILVGGALFAHENYRRTGIARIWPGGELDEGFDLGLDTFPIRTGHYTVIHAILEDSSGNLIVAGRFPGAQDQNLVNIARVHPDGRLDVSFVPPPLNIREPITQAVLLPDDRVVVAMQPPLEDTIIMRLNRDGSSDPEFHAIVSGTVHDLKVQENGDLLVAGSFTAINGEPASNIARLLSGLPAPSPHPAPAQQVLKAGNTLQLHFQHDRSLGEEIQWLLNGRELPGKTHPLLSIFNARGSDSGQYQVRITGAEGEWLSGPARVEVVEPPQEAGRVDLSFFPGLGTGEPPGDGVHALAMQPDGKLFIGGAFERIHGIPRNQLARLHEDGSLDMAFDPPALAPTHHPLPHLHTVENILVQPDGKIVIAGSVLVLLGNTYQGSYYIGRLHADGTRDHSFPITEVMQDSGALYGKRSILLEPPVEEWLLLVLTRGLTGMTHGAFRFQRDGEPLDPPEWSRELQPNEEVHAARFLAHEQLLLAGAFTQAGGAPNHGMVLLDRHWEPDPSFNTGEGPAGVQRPVVLTFEVLADGKILVGGSFTRFGGQPAAHLARLHPSGEIDLSFQPAPLDGPVAALALQSDGAMIIAGGYTQAGEFPRRRLARLFPDGSVDPSFNPGDGLPATILSPSSTEALRAPEPTLLLAPSEEHFLIAGHFGLVDEVRRPGLAQLFGYVPRILNGALQPDHFSLGIPTRAGKRYQLQYASSLEEPDWMDIPEASLLGDGMIMELLDPAPGDSRRFYRVISE